MIRKPKNRLCTHCGESIVLVPSATERARKDTNGTTAEFYLNLFTIHPDCLIKLHRGDNGTTK